MIKLSIIIPVYNVEPYIEECLDSLCAQWRNDIEIVVVDDGSTDNSGKICDEYASKYNFIKVVHQDNKGLGAARNTGTLIATGKYIAWIDSDDKVSSEWVEEIFTAINNSTPDVIIYDYIILNKDKETIATYGRKSGIIPLELFINDLMRDIRIQAYAWQKVYKRDLCVNQLFVEDRLPLEDYEIAYRLLADAERVYYIAKPLYYYRQRENSLMRGHNFELTWHSYCLSEKRENEVAIQYKNAARTARCIQAYRVCKFDNKKDKDVDLLRCKEARGYIRKNCFFNLTSKEVTLKWKILFLLTCFKCEKIISFIRRKQV